MSNSARRAARDWRWGTPALLLLIPFLLWPIGNIAWRSVAPEGGPFGAAIAAMAHDPYTGQRLASSRTASTASRSAPMTRRR